MTEKKLAGWAASSKDDTEISNRIKGAVLAFSALIIFVAANFFNITLTSQDIVDIATQLGAVGGLMWSLYGGVLAVIHWIAAKRG